MALAFKEPKVARLKEILTKGEFLEWKTFYSIRPFGDEWDDYRVAWHIGHMRNILSKLPNLSRYDLSPMMPHIVGREHVTKYQSPAEQAAMLDML